MTELLLVALLLSLVWLVATGLLSFPMWVGALGVAACFIVALWLGNLLDADEWDGGDE